MDILERCIEICRKKPGVVAFPDSLDPRIFEAVAMMQREGVIEPILVASPFELRGKVKAHARRPDWYRVVDPGSPDILDRNTQEFMEIRRQKGKPVTAEEAAPLMNCPLVASAMMVRRGEAEIGVGGNLSPTAAVLRTGLGIIPRKEGIKTISSFFLMISPDGQKKFIFADCAVIPEPGSETLADIAITSSEMARVLLGEEPRVALMSFSSKGSAKHPRAEVVREAVEIARKRSPNLLVDGELQFDAAALPEVAATKAPGSVLEGKANVLVFPSLEAGNIGYKLVQRLAGYTAVGPFLQGFAGGWHDLSRGCSVKDIYKVAVMGICLQRGAAIN